METFPPRSCPYHGANGDTGDTAMREPGPMTKVTLRSGQEVWAASRHADVRAVLTDPAFSSNRTHPNFPNPTGRPIRRNPAFKPTLINLDPPEHGPARRSVLGEFTVKRLASLGPRIQEIVDEHLDTMLANETHTADLVAQFALPVPSLVICELLGVPYADHDFFQSASRTLLSRTSTVDEVKGAADALRGYLDKLVTAKEADPTDDLIG